MKISKAIMQELIDRRVPIKAIAEEYGMTYKAVELLIDMYGITAKRRSHASEEEIKVIQGYLAQGLNAREIASLIGRTHESVNYTISKNGLDRPFKYRKNKLKAVREMYWNKKWSIAKIAKYYGVGEAELKAWMERYQIIRKEEQTIIIPEALKRKAQEPRIGYMNDMFRECACCGKSFRIYTPGDWRYKKKVDNLTYFCCSYSCLNRFKKGEVYEEKNT